MAIEIVDLPSYKMVDLSIVFWYVYQRVPQITPLIMLSPLFRIGG